jgi:regulator of cell morphogenesis and NO signaling
MHIHPHETLGDIVAADYRAAAVFEQFGLDFCCGGRQTLYEACQQPAVDVSALMEALGALAVDESAVAGAAAAEPLDALIDHIVSRHHAYVRAALPTLRAHTARIAAIHGDRSPELREVARVVDLIAGGLALHMMKEEEILFPYIRSLVEAERAGRRIPPGPFGTVYNPIRMMEAEHQGTGDEMRRIRELTRNYALPDYACATYRVCFEELQDFERDLHRHVHLENNVLFPRALQLEERLS